VSGSVAQRPHHGGHTWVFLQYLLGFRRLGWDVLFVDRLEPDMCIDAQGRPTSFEQSANLRYLTTTMEQFGLGRDWSLLYDGGREVVGVDRDEARRRIAAAPFLLNVMGYLDDDDLLAAANRRVFLDIDPGFGQMWSALGLHDLFAGHDAHVTIGENIGRDDCSIPTCGIEWVTTKQPVVLDEWPAEPLRPHAPFTSIGSWRGPFGPIDYEGRTYGLRVHEFRRFFDLPRRVDSRFDLALDIDEAEVDDLAALRDGGWNLVDPRDVAADTDRYRQFIRGSKAEVMVAKNLYVTSRSGWFSDRSACYLASGRPVLAQDTGLEHLLPTGRGLVAFSTLDDAVAGVEAIEADYEQHCRAARELAQTHFASDVVLGRLLERLGVT
jgi:hypothetical protein